MEKTHWNKGESGKYTWTDG